MSKYLKLFNTHSEYETYMSEGNVYLPNISHCIQENECHFDPSNGFDYVDLGLPSKNLWATCNLGADSITDKGLYFQWGDTKGYNQTEVGSGTGQKYFSWTDYKFAINASQSTADMIKYNGTDNKTVLDDEDNAIKLYMKGKWDIPTKTDAEELIANTDCTTTTINSKSVFKLTSKINGNVLYFPKAGEAGWGRCSGDNAEIIVKELDTTYKPEYSLNLYQWNYMLGCVSSNTGYKLSLSRNSRYSGLSLRGVLKL